jgi:hypothetical protein
VIPAHKARKRRGRNSSLLLQASATQAHRVSEVIAEGVNLQPKPHRGIAERRESCSVVKPNNLILSIFRHGAGPRQDRRRARRDVWRSERRVRTEGLVERQRRKGDMGATTDTNRRGINSTETTVQSVQAFKDAKGGSKYITRNLHALR